MTGYRNKATTFDFDVKGENVVITSNATTYIEAMEVMKLPADSKLKRAVTYPIYDGKNDERTFIDVVWGVEGSLPSGKAAVEYLVEKGAITREQAAEIYDAPETRL